MQYASARQLRLLPMLLLCSSSQAQLAPINTQMAFTEVSSQAGLDGALRLIAPGGRYGVMAGGGAVGDFNNDGYHDIFMLAGGGYEDYLFINNTDGTFSNQASGWGVDRAHHSFGASACDFNNDGYLDIFVTSYGDASFAAASGKMILYKNNGPDNEGNWSFTDVAVESGVNRLLGTTRDGLGSGWGDIDLDGDLDLFVCGYNESRMCNRLFRNDGPDSDGNYSFTDITALAGLERTGVYGFLPQFVDMNGDRYPELIHIADAGSSKFYLNDGTGAFIDDTDDANGIETANGMGVDVGDVDNDGLLDFYVSSITYTTTGGPGNVLLMHQPDGSYINTGRENGTSSGYWGWGVLIADFDLDTDRDLAETNGYLGTFSQDPAVLFENLGDGHSFQEVAETSGFIHRKQGRGLVRLDIENDGDLDIAIFENNGKLRLYRNDIINQNQPTDRNWIRITLDTRARDALAPNGIGSMIRVISNGQTQLLPMHCGSSHASASPIEVHAGLGDAASIDLIQIAWADGSFTTLSDIPADQVLEINAPATPVDYAPDAITDFHDIIAFLGLYQNADFAADHNGDFVLNFYDVAAFIKDFKQEMTP